MRQNTIAVQGATRQAMLSEDREILFKQLDNPHVYPWVHDVGSLTDEQKIQASAWLVAFSRVREGIWLQYENGVIDERTFRSYLSPFVTVLSLEHTREWWRRRTARGVFDQGFVDHVNEILADMPIQPQVSIAEETGWE